MKDDGTHVIERRWRNEYGEELVLRYDPQAGNGTLSGDDVDGELQIIDGMVQGDYMLGPDEYEWLRTTWRELADERFVGFCPERLIKDLARALGVDLSDLDD